MSLVAWAWQGSQALWGILKFLGKDALKIQNAPLSSINSPSWDTVSSRAVTNCEAWCIPSRKELSSLNQTSPPLPSEYCEVKFGTLSLRH